MFWKKKTTASPSAPAVQPIQWREEDIPRYPPFMKGLPVVPPDKLLETQGELLERIANTAIATPDIFGCYYTPAIKRFAAFAHLLPASQSHHHRGAGGLLRHSIEVGLWALQSADKVLLDAAKNPSQRREMEPRWQLAVFLAALCHDAGKPVTDLTVTNRDGSSRWNPLTEDLYGWATGSRVDRYFLHWKEGRARSHTALSSLIGERIIGSEALAWIAEVGTELVVWLMESLGANPSPANFIYDLVIKADQTSVERDLKTMGVAMAGYEIGVPVERHLTDIMRRFIKEGVWLVNEPGARLWNIGGNIYLVWPAAGEEIARQVREDGIPGIPRTPDGILDMLVERQLAFVREDAQPSDRYWKIQPSCLSEKIPDIKLQAIRLRDEAMVSTIPIPQVEGRIVNDVSIRAQPHPPGENSPADGGWRIDPPRKQGGYQKDNDAPHRYPDSAPPPEGGGFRLARWSDESSAGKKGGKIGDGGQGQLRPDVAAHPAAAHAAQDDVSVDARQARTEEPSPPLAEPVERKASTPDAIPQPEASARTHGRAESDRRDDPTVADLTGAVGEALKALAHDLRTGDKQWGSDATVDASGQVFLRWPDAFAGYGLTPKSILDELATKGWLWIDPMAPLKKVLDTEMGGRTVKAIRLERDASQAVVREAGFQTGKPSQPENGVSRADRREGEARHKETSTKTGAKTDEAPAEAGTPSDGAPSPDAGEQARGKAKPKSRRPGNESAKGASLTKDERRATVKEPEGSISERSQPSPAEVIEALKDAPAKAEQDGWVVIAKYEAMTAIKRRGIKLTHSGLAKLGQQNPSRLAVDGVMVKYRP